MKAKNLKKSDSNNRYLAFIESGRQQMSLLGVHTGFVAENKWSAPYWDVYASLKNRPSSVARRSAVLWFAAEVPGGQGRDYARKAQRVAAFGNPFDDFSKAFIVNVFAKKPTVTYASLYRPLDVLRSLYGVLSPGEPDPKRLCLEHFLQVERELIRRWELPDEDSMSLSHASVRSKGEQLQTVGTLLDSLGVLPNRLGFRTRIPLERRERVDRHSEPFKARKERLFPEPDVFYFLAELANKPDLDIYWRLRLRAIELQVALGRRISEILLLPRDCLVFGENNAIGVRYFARKGADPFVAWVPRDKHFESASQIVQRAVEDIQTICGRARQRARQLEACKEWQDFPLSGYKKAAWRTEAEVLGLEGEDEEYLIASEFAAMFGVSPTHFTSFLRARQIPYEVCDGIVPRYERLRRYSYENKKSVSESETFDRQLCAVLEEWRAGGHGRWLTAAQVAWQMGVSESEIRSDRNKFLELKKVAECLAERWPDSQPNVTRSAVARLDDMKRSLFNEVQSELRVNVYPNEPPVSLSDMLFVVSKWELDRSRTTNEQVVQLLKVHHVQFFLRGSTGSPSVFEAFGRPDLDAKSHGFRRWVTTEGRRAGVNNLILARWMGRTAVQNDVYDYNEPDVFTEEKLGIPLDVSRVYGNVRELLNDMKERGVSVTDRQKFLAAEMQGFTTTDKGGCSHEWAITPCQKARACYNGCPEYYVIKGRIDHYERAKQEKVSFERALALARDQVGTAYYANGYVQLYEAQLKAVKKVIRIHEDRKIPDGAIIQVFSRSGDALVEKVD